MTRAAVPGARHARRRRDDPERGSESLELAVLAPCMLALIGLIIVGGRVATAHQAVESAAAQAARSASITRTQQAASSSAQNAAAATLANEGLRCSSTSVAVDTTGFATPPGTPASVTATVTCVVAVSGFVPGLDGRTVTATMTSAIDTFRER